MKFIWIVGINGCETNNVMAVCATEEIARRELFKVRDEMIRSFDYQIEITPIEYIKQRYRKQKAILLNDNPQKWENNSPYDYPYMSNVELLEE